VSLSIELKKIIRDYPLETGEHKASMGLALLKGSARDKFQQTLLTLDMENNGRPEEQKKSHNEIFNMTLLEVGKSYFPIMYAYQKQLVYVQHYLKVGRHTVRNVATH
jgi:hypothetical protein